MANLNIPVGISDFSKIIRNGFYYIDKTGLIQDLLMRDKFEVLLFTRPRRFGKTLAMSMLAEFFDIRKDNSEIFEGLNISQNQELCSVWMNLYPTLFLSFKEIDGRNFDNAYAKLKALISRIYIEHIYLLDSAEITEYEKSTFSRIADKTASLEEIQNGLAFLMQLMMKYYHKPVILLLDEYDVPIAKAEAKGYYDQMMEVISALLGSALKDNPCLCFAVITGCLRITKESIFTGTNNFVVDTISDSRYNEYFGFTDVEVQKLLQDTECEPYAEKIRTWYDGYRFGDLDIYCPWDVLNYIQKLRSSGAVEPENFWANTSDNAVIRSFLDRTDFDVTEKFETLLNGGCICESIVEDLTYNALTSSEQNLWSLLYLTGYLTKTGENTGTQNICLKIPNAEVRDIFQNSVVEWFNERSVKSDRHLLFQALWNADTDKLSELLSDLLFNTISYHDYAESYYHAFLTGLFSSAGYIVESNYESGFGRPDLMIKDRKTRSAVIIEVKISNSQEQLLQDGQKALEQIETMQYAQKTKQDGFRNVICYGISFFKKQCLVQIS